MTGGKGLESPLGQNPQEYFGIDASITITTMFESIPPPSPEACKEPHEGKDVDMRNSSWSSKSMLSPPYASSLPTSVDGTEGTEEEY